LIRQKLDEHVAEYIRRFRDIKSRCYSLIISKKDLTQLALNGLRSHIKEKLEGYKFFHINEVMQRALAKKKLKSKILNLDLIVLVCIWLIVILQMMTVKRFMLLNLYGHLMISQVLVLL